MAINSTRKATGLRANCLSFPETLSQSVANIAPVATPALNVSLVFAIAGNGTWLTYGIATIGLVLVGININQFACRSAYPGTLYSSIAKSLGPTAGMLAGWSLISAYLFTGIAVSCAFANYTNIALADFQLQAPPILLIAICASIAWYYAYTDVQLSTILMLSFEAISVGLILLMSVFILQRQDSPIDLAQLTLQGISGEGIRLGLVLAIFSYVGFESATVLGGEAKHPQRSIPKAVIASVVLSGLFFIFVSYIEVLAFQGADVSLAETANPLSYLASQAGAPLLGLAISVGVIFSFFTCSLACINSGARVTYSLARHEVFHPLFGRAHIQNETPHNAVTFLAILMFLIPAFAVLFGIPILQVYNYTGTLATFGFLLVYILISIAAPIEMHRNNRLRRYHLVISFFAILLMMIPVIASFYPVPVFPYNIFPYLFLLYLAAGAWLFSIVRRRSPQIDKQIAHDFNPLHNRLSD